MAFTIERDTLKVCSYHAIATWLLCGAFLAAFPVAIVAGWRAGPDTIPLWTNLVFTGLFLAAGPFLIREIADARIVRASLDRASGVIRVAQSGLTGRSSAAKSFDDIERVEMRTSDNDGEFHTLCLVFRDGTDFAFRHGNYRQGVEEERDRFLAFLRQRRPDVQAVEKYVV